MFKRTLVNLILVIAMLLTLGVSVVSAAPPSQAEVTYTVKLGDTLWALAEKYLGSGPAYRAIVMATNAKNFEDPSFARIRDPSLIHPGWKFLIPSAEEAEELMATWYEGRRFKIGQVTDVGGIDDRSFNETAWRGVLDAINEWGVTGHYLESHDMADYEPNIREFMREEYDLIVTVGFLLGDTTKEMAEADPDQKFSIVDYTYDPPLDNVVGQAYATDEAAFLAGYLAAGMSKTGKVGTFGGIKIPPVTIFEVGLEKGIEYYNEKHGTNVELLGWKTDPAIEGGGDGLFTGNFESTDDGRRYGESLMDEGVDILLPVAGPVGLGTAAACKERGTMMIGVDTDWYISAPEFKEVYLTSILKNMNVVVHHIIGTVIDGTFEGGTYVGTLENGGVGVAPFHYFDRLVPDEIKADLEELKKGIIAGTIDTGWPPK